jgi:hypothetical protein
MKIKILLPLLLISANIYSQINLYMPIEFQNAYKNGTRAYDGNPGKNYWLNTSAYTIEAEVEA